jgi:hypothetical protein
MYWIGTVKISNFLNSLLHEVLGCVPTIILIILFVDVNCVVLWIADNVLKDHRAFKMLGTMPPVTV